MRSVQHTQQMLRWWAQIHIDRADLAIRRPSGQMLWQRDVPLEKLPLSWARAENIRGADVYVRPARHHPWPVVFLDDLDAQLGIKVLRHYAALLIHTSREGGCHLWMRCAWPLSEPQRRDAQRHLVARTGADPGSISGEHLGRLAGMKNWKRHGQWVNFLHSSTHLPPWEPRFLLSRPLARPAKEPISAPLADQPHLHLPSERGRDHSPSGMEWGWVCGALASGLSARDVYTALLEHCRARRGQDAERYALRTVRRALQRTGPAESL